MTAATTAARPTTTARRRVRVGAGIATALLACAVVLTYLGQFGVGTAVFLGTPSQASTEDWLAWFWIYVGLGVALTISVMVALSVRAWVTLVFAILFAAVCGVMALNAYPNVRDVVSPAPMFTLDSGACPSPAETACDRHGA